MMIDRSSSLLLIVAIMIASATMETCGQSLTGTKQLNGGHYYSFYFSNSKPSDALTFCAQFTFKNQRGYLVTITTKEENDFVLENRRTLMPTANVTWISGDCLGQEGIYLYNSGPEKGTLLFNTYSGESPSFADFNYYEPSMFSFLDERYVAFDTKQYSWNNMDISKETGAFICEYGGLDDPYINPIRTIGNPNATITNILNMPADVSAMQVTFTNSGGRSFSASNIRKTSDTTLKVNIPAGTGTYNVTITNGVQQKWTTTFRYEAPHISVVYINQMQQNDLVTVTGKNFGTNATAIKPLILGVNSATCTRITVIDDGFLTCTLSGHITGYIYPINITVDSLFHTATKPVINYNDRYFSTFWGNSQRDESKTYSHALINEGLSGYLTYIDSDSTQKLLKLLARFYEPHPWPYFWTSLSYDATKGYILLDGPNAGKPVCNAYPVPTVQSAAYYYDFTNLNYENATSTRPWGILSEFIIDRPQYILDNYSIPTAGANISALFSKGGTYFSQYRLEYHDQISPWFKLDFYSPRKDVVFNPGYGGPFPFIVTSIDSNNVMRSSITKYFSYIPPSITKITPIGPDGGTITITGDNLFTNPALISVKVGNDTCDNIAFIMPHQVITCTISSPSGSLQASRSVEVSLNGTKGTSTSFHYATMVLDDVSSGVTNQTTVLTIRGKSFANNNVSISIAGEQCYNITLLSSEEMICQFSGRTPQPGNESMVVTVNMAGFTISKGLFYYANDTSCPRVNDLLCAGNGRCSQGTCYCNDGWTQANCTKPTMPNDKTPGMTNGTATNPSNVDFISAIRFLRELNTTGHSVRTLDMAGINWQTDQATGISNGTFTNDSVTVSLVVLHVNQTIDHYQFAGQIMSIAANSLKLIISISNWSFDNRLNSLQVIIESSTDSKTTSACGTEHPTNGEVATNSYHIVAGNSILQVKFASHLFVDSRVAMSSFSQLDETDHLLQAAASNAFFSIWTAINVPNFKVCVIDPSMVALIATDKETCDKSSPWKIIVIAVVAGVVGVAVLLGTALLIKKKVYWNMQEKKILKRQISSINDSRL